MTYVRDEEKLYEAVIVKQINSPPLPWAKDPHERGLREELKKPPSRRPQPPPPPRRPQPPSPRRPGNPGPHP